MTAADTFKAIGEFAQAWADGYSARMVEFEREVNEKADQ